MHKDRLDDHYCPFWPSVKFMNLYWLWKEVSDPGSKKPLNVITLKASDRSLTLSPTYFFPVTTWSAKFHQKWSAKRDYPFHYSKEKKDFLVMPNGFFEIITGGDRNSVRCNPFNVKRGRKVCNLAKVYARQEKAGHFYREHCMATCHLTISSLGSFCWVISITNAQINQLVFLTEFQLDSIRGPVGLPMLCSHLVTDWNLIYTFLV